MEPEAVETPMEKLSTFVKKNKEPIIRGACIVTGIAIGAGLGYWLASSDFTATSTDTEMVEIDEMEE